MERGAGVDTGELARRLDGLIAENRRIHDAESLNLDPASNVMSPVAEAMLSSGLGTRPSLGRPGAKYETGLEAIEEIELLADDLARRVFDVTHVELRTASGAMANVYAFLATCEPGDAVIVPPASIGGHVTHHRSGAAGLLGLDIHEAPIDADRLTVDVSALAELAERVRPRLITVGGSLNLVAPPVAELRRVADAVGARLLVDAAHMSGLFAGRWWPSPIAEGAHLLTMSTYKSLGGPPAGIVCTDDEELAARLDAIAHPGLTANFDVAKTAALASTLLDWIDCGAEYATAMVETARALAEGLASRGIPVVAVGPHRTDSHHVAVDARGFGGGATVARHLRSANLLACGIGLPVGPVPGSDEPPGLRLGTPEMVRWGMGPAEADHVAGFIARALTGPPEAVAADVSAFRAGFDRIHFVRGGPVAPLSS
jgi:glycine hydroxymethyltransferase